MSKAIKRITIVNAHWNNRGDEAALMAILIGLKKEYPNARITVIIKDGKSVEQFPEIENVDSFAAKFNAKIWDIWLCSLTRGVLGFDQLLKKTVKQLAKTDLIVYSPGGSVINHRFFWRKQMEYLVPFICAKLYRIPMMVAAPSMGPFDTTKSNRIIKWLLKTPKVFCVREEISKAYLEEIGITEIVHTTIDSAFYYDIDINDNKRKLEAYKELKVFLEQNKKVVGITITDFQWHVKYNKDEELRAKINDSFQKFIEHLEGEGFATLFIPQLFGNQNDYGYMSKFVSTNSFIMSDSYDTFFQQFIISKLYAVVGMRYHSNIFAAKMGVPFIAVVYEEKMEGFIQLAELNEYSIALNDLTFEMLVNKFNLLENNYAKIKNKFALQQPEWKKQAERTIDLLGSFKN